MILTLTRAENTPDGVFGTMDAAGLATLYTLEDDWKDNTARESCIPAGTYPLHRTIYQKTGYETFEVTGVPDRSRILIHPANTEEDVMGCIGVGLRRGVLRVPDEDDPAHPLVAKRAIVASREAFRRLMEFLAPVDEAQLVVVWSSGLP
jgi:hypothetical protein